MKSSMARTVSCSVLSVVSAEKGAGRHPATGITDRQARLQSEGGNVSGSWNGSLALDTVSNVPYLGFLVLSVLYHCKYSMPRGAG